jgi:hypothetical protein
MPTCEGFNESDTRACEECHARAPTRDGYAWTWVIRPDGSMICSEAPAAPDDDDDEEEEEERRPTPRKSGGGWAVPVVVGVLVTIAALMVVGE